jgi:putative intracellular protease/amidase
MLKKIALSIGFVIVIIIAFLYWFITSILPSSKVENIELISPQQIAYIANGLEQNRGKILAVVTSTDVMGSSGKSTGYELTELSRAYYVFTSNGFEVDIASPMGGNPPVVIDDDDMAEFDFAFLNDSIAQNKAKNTLAMKDVKPDEYEAIYFVGGKGAMFDFPENQFIQNAVRELYESGKTIGAICHGPAALVNVALSDGSALIANKTVSSFTNDEELFLIPNAKDIFPFMLESKLREQGANIALGKTYLRQVSHDDNLITGQNPWSIWKTAEAIVKQIGYEPIRRKISANERAVTVLNQYHNVGFDKAKQQLNAFKSDPLTPIDKELIATHSILAVMSGEYTNAFNILRLLHTSRD